MFVLQGACLCLSLCCSFKTKKTEEAKIIIRYPSRKELEGGVKEANSHVFSFSLVDVASSLSSNGYLREDKKFHETWNEPRDILNFTTERLVNNFSQQNMWTVYKIGGWAQTETKINKKKSCVLLKWPNLYINTHAQNTHTQTHKHAAPSWNANLWLASLCSSVISQKPSHSGAQKAHSPPELLCVGKNYGTQMNSFMWERIYSIIIDLHSFNAT